MYFSADWCQPCKETTPIVEALNLETDSPKFFIINSDDVPEMIKDFDILGVPTFIFIKNGEEVRRERGLARRDKLEEYIRYIEQ